MKIERKTLNFLEMMLTDNELLNDKRYVTHMITF
jgi:hypothetical protein